MKKNIFVGLLIAFCVFSQVSGAVIPVDPGHSGRVLFTGRQPMTIQWTANIDPQNRTQIITTNGKEILAVSNSNEILCFDSKTGSMLWKGLMPEEVKNAPCITASLGIATSVHGWIKGFDLQRGVSMFHFSVGYDELSTPVIGERNIILKGFHFERREAVIMAIDLAKGKDTNKRIPCGFNKQSPTLSTKAMYFAGTKNTNVVAYDQDLTGKLWDVDIGSPIENISTRFDFVCATTSTGKVALIGKDSGQLLWIKQFEAPIKWPASITQNGIFVTTEDAGRLVKIDVATGNVAWENAIKSDSQPLVGREDIIICNGKSVIFFSQETGRLNWQTQLPADALGLPIPVEDQILAVTSAKKLVSLRTAGFEIILSSKSLDMGFATSQTPELSANYSVRNMSGSPQTIQVESSESWLKATGSGIEIAPFDFADILLYTNLSGAHYGKHTATVTVTWPNGKHEFEVTASLLLDEQAVPPKPGTLYIPEQKLALNGKLNIGKNMAQIALFNKGELPINFQVDNSCNWLQPSAYTGTIPPKSSQILYVTIIVGNTQIGENRGMIEILCQETGQSFIVPITFTREYGKLHIVLGMTLNSTVANLNGIKVRARPAPYKTSDDVIMVPLGIIKLALDAESECYEYEYEEPLILLKRPDFTIQLRVGESRLFVENAASRKEIILQSKIEMSKGNVMLPLLGIVQALEGEMRIDEGDKVTLDAFIPELAPQ